QYQSQFLTGDSLADVIAACHAAGIRVLARTDFSKIRRPIYEMHPDWAYRTANGDIVDYNGDVHACVMGDYQQHYALEIIREVLTTHAFDGIFFNMGGFQTRDYSGNYYGPCHCAACQRAFGGMFGLPLPAKEDMRDPVFRKYMVFKRRALGAHRDKVHDLIHAICPDICIDKDDRRGGGFVRQESNTAVDRPLPHWQYSGSGNTKWALGSYPGLISSNTTVDFIDIPYRHVAVSPDQQALRLAQSLANGGALDYYLIGRLDNHPDQSGHAPVKELFHYHAAHGADYVGLTSRADVMLLNDSRNNDSECRGWFRFLLESHFLFDTPQVEAALDLPWARYRAIVLPNLKYVGDALAAKLDAFVAAGGTLIASGETGFYDEDYERRERPALKCLGIEKVELVKEDMRPSYLLLDDKTGFARFPVTDTVYLDGPFIYCQYAAGAQPRLKLVPPHKFGPPERCYWETVLDRPGFVVHAYGQGKAIYVPWLPGELFHRQGHTNTLDFAADLLEGVGGIPRVTGNLSPMVEVTLFANAALGAQLVHLVNTSGHFGTTFYPPVPMRDLVVSLPMPAAPNSAVSLVTGEAVPFTHEGGRLTLRVPTLELMQAIKIT
ncbi:MAG: alpha-amylase family protein, partial [Chloroflexota bacterium]